MKLLLIEDSEKLQFYLGDGLRKVGYEVDITGEGTEGLWYAKTNDYDAIVLDLMLPGLDGLSIVTSLRNAGKETGILILTAKDSIQDRVTGLRMGADDYLTKPFAFDELVARVEALTRQRYGTPNSQINIRGLVVDTASKTASRNGVSIVLTAREYSLLEFLALRRDRVCSRGEIESHFCDVNSAISSNVIDAAVYSLRRKLDVDDKPSVIMTRRGIGYVIVSGEVACPFDDE